MAAEEHVQTALTFLDQSWREFAAGDILQGSEKLWGPVAHGTIDVAKLRGWPTDSHRNLVGAARSLARASPPIHAEPVHRHSQSTEGVMTPCTT